MKTELPDQRLARLNRLSEVLFGEASEVDPAGAEELLRTAGIEPERLKGALYQRMLERSKKYSGGGRPVPALLRQALKDLEPIPAGSQTEGTVARTARFTMTRLLAEIRELPKLLNTGLTPQFTAAYRNRKELSARDIRVLDGVAEDLRKRTGERKTHE